MKHGKLELIEEVEPRINEKNGWKRRRVLVRCDCGRQKVVDRSAWKSGNTRTCGCSYGTHRLSKTKEYRKWIDMKVRCSSDFRQHKDYYDRGIAVCSEWESFERFFSDMGTCPAGYEIDRIDNEKGYSKDNCRWASHSLNQRNKRGIKNIRQLKSGRWHSRSFKDGREVSLGTYDTPNQATAAYNEWAIAHGYPLREIDSDKNYTE